MQQVVAIARNFSLGDTIEEVRRWEDSFDGLAQVDWMERHTEVPIFFCAAYISFVIFGQRYFEKRAPLAVRPIVIAWNLLLATFSIVGATISVPFLTKVLLEKGFRWSLCTDPRSQGYFYSGRVGAWMWFFILSKIPEMIDTVLLIVQKKPVIFLHWFHHFTVMLYCWHSWVVASSTGIYFATMNYAVHAIMYTYYFLMCFSWGRKLVRRFAVLITSLQVLQMIAGIAICVTSLAVGGHNAQTAPLSAIRQSLASATGAASELLAEMAGKTVTATISGVLGPDAGASQPGTCGAIDSANAKMGLGMYLAYFVLFSSLFKKLYLSGERTKRQVSRSPHTDADTTQHRAA